MQRLRVVGIAMVSVLPFCAHADSLALTFDDGLDPRTQPQAGAWNATVIDTPAKAKLKRRIPARCHHDVQSPRLDPDRA